MYEIPVRYIYIGSRERTVVFSDNELGPVTTVEWVESMDDVQHRLPLATSTIYRYSCAIFCYMLVALHKRTGFLL